MKGKGRKRFESKAEKKSKEEWAVAEKARLLEEAKRRGRELKLQREREWEKKRLAAKAEEEKKKAQREVIQAKRRAEAEARRVQEEAEKEKRLAKEAEQREQRRLEAIERGRRRRQEEKELAEKLRQLRITEAKEREKNTLDRREHAKELGRQRRQNKEQAFNQRWNESSSRIQEDTDYEDLRRCTVVCTIALDAVLEDPAEQEMKMKDDLRAFTHTRSYGVRWMSDNQARLVFDGADAAQGMMARFDAQPHISYRLRSFVSEISGIVPPAPPGCEGWASRPQTTMKVAERFIRHSLGKKQIRSGLRNNKPRHKHKNDNRRILPQRQTSESTDAW